MLITSESDLDGKQLVHVCSSQNNGAYKIILHVHPSGGVVIANSSVDCTGSQLPPHARLYTVLLPAGVPMIYRATLKLIKELEDGVAVCDEIVFRVKTNLPEKSFIYHYQSGDYLSVEYPLPKFKLEGQCFNATTQHYISCEIKVVFIYIACD